MNETDKPKRLLRSRDNRFVGGVAAGLANYFSIDPTLVRIAFVLSLAFGGVGLFAYVVMLVLVPLEGPADEPLPPISDRRRGLMIGGAILVGIALVIGAGSGGLGHWLFDFGPGPAFGILFWSVAIVAVVWLGVRALGGGSGPGGGPSDGGGAADPDPGEDGQPGTVARAPSQNAPGGETATAVLPGADPDKPTGADPEGPTEVISAQPDRSGFAPLVGRVMLVVAIGVTALVLLGCLAILSGWVTAQFGSVPMALLLIVLGAGVILSAVRARRQLSIWLLAAALTVAIPLAIVTLADLRIEGSYGSINETPRGAAEIPPDGYRLAAGWMVIDLRKLPFDPGREVPVKVDSGFGVTTVIVPDRVCVTGRMTGRAGLADVRGSESSGVDITRTIRAAGAGVPELELDAEFTLGMIEVVDATDWEDGGTIERGGPGESHRAIANPAASRARADRACAAPQKRKRGSGEHERGSGERT